MIIELKAVEEVTDFHFAQFLKAANLKAGLLLNFSKATLQIKRIVY